MKSECIFVDSQNVVLRTFTRSNNGAEHYRHPFFAVRIFFFYLMASCVPLFPFIFKFSGFVSFFVCVAVVLCVFLYFLIFISMSTCSVSCWELVFLCRSRFILCLTETLARAMWNASTHSLLHHIAFNVHLLAAHWLCNALFQTFYYARG